MKKRILLAALAVSTLFSSQAFAGSYTKSDPYANSSYNRGDAQTYVNLYAETPNQWYYDYGINREDGGDCTNFASQMLFHGNLPEKGSYADYNAWASWYYDGKDVPWRSYSWPNAHQFRYHWANVNGSGNNRAYKYTVYTMQQAYDNFDQIYYDLWPGDVVQYVQSWDGYTWHTQVVHDYDYNGNLYAAQHTPNWIYYSLKERIRLRLAEGDTGWFVTYRIKQATN